MEDNRNPASPTIFSKTSPSPSPLSPHHVPPSVNNFILNSSPASDILPLDSGPSSANQVEADQPISEQHNSGTELALNSEELAPLPNSRTLSNQEASEVPNIHTDDVLSGDESQTEESSESRKNSAPVSATNGVSKREV